MTNGFPAGLTGKKKILDARIFIVIERGRLSRNKNGESMGGAQFYYL